ncbi:MAG: type IV toxin-antitoxin system AbiEi family antitoxin domain-containing protein [Candidatus Aminicenantales bacterium]|jgi:predicted transcriptional regulator of viral defense system
MTQEDKILELLKVSAFLRSRDLKKYGLSRTALSRLFRKGRVVRTERGLYMKPGEVETEHFSLLEVTKKVPGGVICLLSALSFHRIGTQNPHQVWIAIDRKSAKPRIRNTGMRIVWFSEASLHYGVEQHNILGIALKVTGPAKTVADCFKYRNKIGLDVAIEALREGLRGRRFTADDLYRAALVCRIWNVIRPYAEAMV